MASFAKSKVERFQDDTYGSSLGPGDYDPRVPKSTAHGAGAVSLGFTAPKGIAVSDKEEPLPDETEATFSAARERRATVGGVAARRLAVGGSRLSVNSGTSRLDKVEAEQQAKQLSWSEREREKLEAEVSKLRLREVRYANVLRTCRALSICTETPEKRLEERDTCWRTCLVGPVVRLPDLFAWIGDWW